MLLGFFSKKQPPDKNEKVWAWRVDVNTRSVHIEECTFDDLSPIEKKLHIKEASDFGAKLSQVGDADIISITVEIMRATHHQSNTDSVVLTRENSLLGLVDFGRVENPNGSFGWDEKALTINLKGDDRELVSVNYLKGRQRGQSRSSGNKDVLSSSRDTVEIVKQPLGLSDLIGTMNTFISNILSCKFITRAQKDEFAHIVKYAFRDACADTTDLLDGADARKRTNATELAIKATKEAFLKHLNPLLKDDKLLGYLLSYTANNLDFKALFVGRESIIKLNSRIIPELTNFIDNSVGKFPTYIDRGYKMSECQNRGEFLTTKYAKEVREQFKVALLDTLSSSNYDTQLRALKNNIYDVVLEYKEHIRNSGEKFRETGLKRAQDLQEAVALAKDINGVKAALKTCFSSYHSLWRNGVSHDSLVAFFDKNENFIKQATQELGLARSTGLEQSNMRSAWNCFHYNKVAPNDESQEKDLDGLKNGLANL